MRSVHRVCSATAAFALAALGTAWPKCGLAENVQTQLQLVRGSELQVAALHDGFHLGLIVAGLDSHALSQAMLPLHAEAVSVLPFGRNEQLAVLRFAKPVRSARAKVLRVSEAARGSGRRQDAPADAPAKDRAAPGTATAASTTPAAATAPVAGAATLPGAGSAATPASTPKPKKRSNPPRMVVQIDVELTEPRDAVLSHVMHEKLPLPKTLAHHRIYDAERAFVEGRLAEAELMLAGLKQQGPFAAWIAVRQGDLAVHHQDVEAACGHYLAAQAASEVRVAAQLGALRARVLGCDKRMAVPYSTLLAREGRDDPVGLMLAKEAQWALGSETDLTALDEALAAGHDQRGELLPTSLYDALAARRLRLRPPFEQLLANVRTPLSAQQREAFDLGLMLGQAHCTLDIPTSWQPPNKHAKSWAKLSAAQRASLLSAVKQCGGLDDPKHAAAMARAPAPEVVGQLNELERRVVLASKVSKATKTMHSAP